MIVNFLGTNGWFHSKTGETTCVLIESNKCNIILDLGSGLKNICKIKLSKKPILIFISHLHLDHISGIHFLSKVFNQKITIHVHKFYKKKLINFFSSPYTKSYKKFKNKINLKSFSLSFKEKKYLNFSYKKLNHSDDSYGLRFEIENKVISYITDTSDCKSVDTISKKADLLIIEANNNISKKKQKFHLNVNESVDIGLRNLSKKIALIHFDPIVFDTQKKRSLIRKFYPNRKKIIITKDMMKIRL